MTTTTASATVKVRQALADLATIYRTASEWHRLVYDRAGIDYQHTRRGRDPNAPPVGRWDEHGSITAAADIAAHDRWRQAHQALRVAWFHIRPDGSPSPLASGDTPRRVQRAAADLADRVRCGDVDGDRLAQAVELIARAARLLPDIFDPPAPVFCRNPRDRGMCKVEVANTKRQLCRSCDQHERDQQRAVTRRRRTRRR